MLIVVFYVANLLVLLLGAAAFRAGSAHRKFAVALLQALFLLPLLAAEFLAVAAGLVPVEEGYGCALGSQNLLLIVWTLLARQFHLAMAADGAARPTALDRLHGPVVAFLLGVAAVQFLWPDFALSDGGIAFPSFGAVYLSSVVSVAVQVLMAWQLEAFWRQLPKPRRPEYGVLVVGIGLVCAVQGWAGSYRLTYLRLTDAVVTLQAALLLLAWALMAYAVLRHRLLNRKLFISRRVVYAFVAPAAFSAYLVGLGAVALVARVFGFPFHLVVGGFFAALGLVAVAALALSEAVRQRVRFFISTHFYVNKYEYRDEWLAFSALLQGAHTEAAVLRALYRVLADSLYSRELWLWSGTEAGGFGLAEPPAAGAGHEAWHLGPADPVIRHLGRHPRLDLEAEPAPGEEEARARLGALPAPRPVLVVPLAAGGQLVGCVGLGPEFTGGRYGHDDFDLLAALGSQAASAIVAARLTEETARLREQRALHGLSAFLLHDLKNAASILSLVHANAREHMGDPEFQKDVLTAIGDALRRMDKVRSRLGALQHGVEPAWQTLELGPFLHEFAAPFPRRLPGLTVEVDCPDGVVLSTDPQLLATVLENLLLNSYEAGA